MVDFMVQMLHICHGAVGSKSLPDDVILLVGYLLYESLAGRGKPSTYGFRAWGLVEKVERLR